MMLLDGSDWTPKKQEAFGQYLMDWSAIGRKIQYKWQTGRWIYIDLTSASGLINTDDGMQIPGSPLIALKTFLQENGLAIDCIFVEQNKNYVASLTQILPYSDSQRVRYWVKCCDNRKVLENLKSVHQYGLLYWDGLARDIYPTKEINYWLERHPKHDLLLMVSANAQKRMRRDRLDNLLLTTSRTMYVTEPHGPWQWIFAFGTNWRELPHKISKLGTFHFHASDSSKGKEILDLLGTTYQEREERDQMRLW